jgi:hypothetical protein
MGLAGVLALQGRAALAYEDYSDPLRPPSSVEVVDAPTIPFFRIKSRLKQVEQEIEAQTKVLDALASFQAEVQFDRFGYHSDYLPAVERVPDNPLWTLEFDAGITRQTFGLVLVPAIDQQSSDLKGYAFPKRFRICSFDKNGQVDKVLVDWTTQDFPDPGMRPVYFAFSKTDPPKTKLRLEVFSGHEEDGREFFALGRVYPIRQGEQQKAGQVSASSSFESLPYWSVDNLTFSRNALGVPLSAQDGHDGNLVLNLPAARLKEPLVIRMELDKRHVLSSINVFPGQIRTGLICPDTVSRKPSTFTVYSPKKRREDGVESVFRRRIG